MKVEMLYPIPCSDGFDVFDGPIQDDGFVCQNKLWMAVFKLMDNQMCP